MNSKGNMTAVEWLINELFNESTVVVTKENNPTLFEVIEQAKQMEKEQIEKAFNKGLITENVYYGYDDKKSEQYYNETFKNKKK